MPHFSRYSILSLAPPPTPPTTPPPIPNEESVTNGGDRKVLKRIGNGGIIKRIKVD